MKLICFQTELLTTLFYLLSFYLVKNDQLNSEFWHQHRGFISDIFVKSQLFRLTNYLNSVHIFLTF